MIQEFENRLAVVLGNLLSAPFKDRVFAAGTEPSDNQAKILLGVEEHKPWLAEFASSKPERVPGQTDFRRILRLETSVTLAVIAADGQGRPQRRAGFDQLLYLLEEPDMADGSSLVAPGDQGFFIESMKLGSSELPLSQVPDQPNGVRLTARGWFWPVGQVGQTGVAITQTHIRAASLDVKLVPQLPDLVAGGAPVTLQLQLRDTGFVLSENQAPQALGVDFLALVLRAASGGPGDGQLSGDALGTAGLVLVNVASDGLATFTYTPPAQPGEDILHVSLAQGGAAPAEKQAGKTLTKLSLMVRAS